METAPAVPGTSTPPQPATHSTSTPPQPATHSTSTPPQPAAHEEEERQIALAIQLSLAQNVQEEGNAYDEEEDRQLAVALALSLSLEENLQSDEAAETNSSPAHAHPLTELQQITQECEYCCSSPVEVVFSPCGHVSCKDCSIKILDYDSTCPRCRRVINNSNKEWQCGTHSQMEIDSDYGAFTEKLLLQQSHPSHDLPLSSLTFAVKDIFEVAGYVTGFGNPDWARTHPAAESTAPSVSTILRGGATCIGKTVMDEMAYSINGENKHYGTPVNPRAPDRVPGGSSSGSAVVVGADLADFSLGTDTGGSVRVPASYCGIFGFRPSHGVISTSGVIPMAQSFDTVGWFARDPVILNRVGRVLLQLPDVPPVRPTQLIIAEDCFQLSSIPSDRVKQVMVHSFEKLFGGHLIKHANLGDVVKDKVPSLNCFLDKGNAGQEYNIPSLAALSSAMRILQRHEFKNNHGEWVSTVRPDLGPGISERVWEAVRTADENINLCCSVKTELCAALTELLGDAGLLAIPTVPGAPPKLQTEPATLETFRARAFSLLSIAGVSGFCQVSIPLGMYENLPVSVSLLAKHGSDGFLLNLVENLYGTLKEQVESLDC